MANVYLWCVTQVEITYRRLYWSQNSAAVAGRSLWLALLLKNKNEFATNSRKETADLLFRLSYKFKLCSRTY